VSRRKDNRRPTAAALEPHDAEILLAGPWSVGLSLVSPEVRHDRLRGLWARHESDIRAEAARRGVQSIWFEERDWFVAEMRGERGDEQ
jgi:hypothetical protein